MTQENRLFKLVANYAPAGDQISAISDCVQWIDEGVPDMTIHGVTGSGKTFTMANIIAQSNRPAIIYSPNKILAWQLYNELREFFPENQVHYYVSTFDMYRPEFVKKGEYHEKQSVANQLLESMVLDALAAISSGRRDTIIVTSSSCLYGTGSPEMFKQATLYLDLDHPATNVQVHSALIHAGYNEEKEGKLTRGHMIVRQSMIMVCTHNRPGLTCVWELKFDPEGFLSRIRRISLNDETKEVLERKEIHSAYIFPATRHTQDVFDEEEKEIIQRKVMKEAILQRASLDKERHIELMKRVEEDMANWMAFSYFNGIENYAWYFNRSNLDREYTDQDYENLQPHTLFNYLQADTLFFIDESHLALGQIEGAAIADYTRKDALISHGIRLPSCVINRPLKKTEVRNMGLQTVYVSATPRPEELTYSQGYVTELFIRPTYLLDPEIELVYVDKLEEQGISYVEHVVEHVRQTKANGGAVLLRCPDKRICEYYKKALVERGFKAEYMLAETPAPERRKLVDRLQGKSTNLDNLTQKEHPDYDPRYDINSEQYDPQLTAKLLQMNDDQLDVIIGVNLIREGLDISRVEKVLIVYADVGGFLNDTTSLIQIIGRAARNVNGKVVMYVSKEEAVTQHIHDAIEQTVQRRALQMEYNRTHGVQPRTAVANSYLNNQIVADAYIEEEDDLLEEIESLGIIEGTLALDDVDEQTAQLQREQKAREKAQKLYQSKLKQIDPDATDTKAHARDSILDYAQVVGDVDDDQFEKKWSKVLELNKRKTPTRTRTKLDMIGRESPAAKEASADANADYYARMNQQARALRPVSTQVDPGLMAQLDEAHAFVMTSIDEGVHEDYADVQHKHAPSASSDLGQEQAGQQAEAQASPEQLATAQKAIANLLSGRSHARGAGLNRTRPGLNRRTTAPNTATQNTTALSPSSVSSQALQNAAEVGATATPADAQGNATQMANPERLSTVALMAKKRLEARRAQAAANAVGSAQTADAATAPNSAATAPAFAAEASSGESAVSRAVSSAISSALTTRRRAAPNARLAGARTLQAGDQLEVKSSTTQNQIAAAARTMRAQSGNAGDLEQVDATSMAAGTANVIATVVDKAPSAEAKQSMSDLRARLNRRRAEAANKKRLERGIKVNEE